MPSPAPSSPAAPSSIDMVRVIRRSMRCLVFGVLGLVPFLGAGLAIQALRLNSAVGADVGESWRPPGLPLWWLAGVLGVGAADRLWGVVGAASAAMLLVIAQSWHIRRSYRPAPGAIWNPGWLHLVWGVVLACAGLSLSLWLLALVALGVGKALASA